MKEKEEINQALCDAKDSMPEPINYQERIVKFTEAIDKLQNPDVDAATKNRHLKDIIEKITYDRPPTVRLTRKNKHLYGYDKIPKKEMFHSEPYELSIIIK